nr:putative GPI-anchored protein pfl2 isoform X1 [Bactrocera oleae]XP_036218875.1 putative GPI-anchored protein pfl2 isoform X1 [Bactrocera oleae]XP_036218876.1 putative GPI-anchored protein pfl2 isoform X1 [Bactrocera oleae]
MTVSVAQTTQGGSTITATTKPCTASSCYASTRSAAMMALALGHRPKSPAVTNIKPTTTGKGVDKIGTTNSNHAPLISNQTNTNNSNYSPPPVGIHSKSPNINQRIASNNTANNRHTTVAAVVHMNGGTGINAGFGSGGSASSGSDNDGFNTSSSSSATALRRLYFKSGRKSKMNSTATTSMTSIPLNAISTAAAAFHTSISGALPPKAAAAAVPKVVIMGSSSASITDGNINTSTDSASTLVTSITHTDTSETCDSLDLGDNSGQSEPLFSSLEEPLLTAIQIDSEHENGTELELTSCNMYNRPDMNVQDSTESQESSLSILTIEPSSTTPLLASHRRQQSNKCGTSAPPASKLTATTGNVSSNNGKERLPNTAPAPSSGTKHFTFDPPISPKSARTSEKSRTHFSFKEQHTHQSMQQTRRSSNWEDQRVHTTNFMEERSPTGGRRDISPNRSKYRAYAAQRHAAAAAVAQAYYEQHQLADDEESLEGTRSKKSRSRETSGSTRQRYTTAGSCTATSPKREQRRSPSSSAPPTMKEGHFFACSGGKPKQLSPASQQRKYSSSSSSGGSERGRERIKDSTMFPFDREAIDYERIQRECFAVDENSSSTTTSSDTDDAEPCSVYERKMSSHHISPSKAGEAFQQYKLLAQQEHGGQQPVEPQTNGPPSRKNSKRIRPSSVIHATIRETQPYVPQTDAFYPQKVKQQSPSEYATISVGSGVGSRQHSPKSYAELNKFEEIASKFEQIPPKQQPHVKALAGGSPSGSNNNALIGSTLQATNGSSNNNGGGNTAAGTVAPTSSPTGSMRGTISPPLPNLRVDFFAESQMMHPRKRSSKKKQSAGKTGAPNAAHDHLDESQRGAGSGMSSMLLTTGAVGVGAGPINVTSNPMDVAMNTPPRATIVVQQPSLSLDNTVETLLIKNEGDFISVEQGKETLTSTGATAAGTAAHARKRNSQQLQHPPHHPAAHHQHATATQQQQQKRDENMRQLLDVTNTLTFEELRDFEMRYGSPHHSRSQSVKTPGSRASGRPNQLCLPQQRSRVASMPNTGVEEEYYRLRHFSITGKGVVNRGDSLKSRRSRSNNSVASSNSSTEHLTAAQIPAPNSARTSATCSLASSRESSTSNPGSGPYRVLMLGGPAVGKSSLVSQFMTSEYLHAYDTSIDLSQPPFSASLAGPCEIRIEIEKPADDDESGEKSVSVLLSGEESELIFIDHAYTEMNPDDCLSSYDPHGYCVIYSAADRSSFTVAEHVLQVLWTNQNIAQKAVILVANKADLARSRLVTSDEGKAMATAYDCKFIETSVGINHNVDELLVGLLSQIRLKLENPEKSRDLFRKRSIRKSKRRACSPLGGACLTGGTNPNTPLGPMNNVISDVNTPPGSAQSSPRKYRGSRTSTSLKVKGLLGRVWARDSKSKSCENLHVL